MVSSLSFPPFFSSRTSSTLISGVDVEDWQKKIRHFGVLFYNCFEFVFLTGNSMMALTSLSKTRVKASPLFLAAAPPFLAQSTWPLRT